MKKLEPDHILQVALYMYLNECRRLHAEEIFDFTAQEDQNFEHDSICTSQGSSVASGKSKSMAMEMEDEIDDGEEDASMEKTVIVCDSSEDDAEGDAEDDKYDSDAILEETGADEASESSEDAAIAENDYMSDSEFDKIENWDE